MQRMDRELSSSILPVLLAATIFFACIDESSRTGSSAGSIGEFVFGFTGGPQQYVVPEGVTSITVTAFGASAGGGWDWDDGGSVGGQGGFGGNVQATLAVTPGETLHIYVGGAGTDGAPSDRAWPPPGTGGWNGGGTGQVSEGGNVGGGGGGASDIRRGGEELADRILVAGGGGGGSGWCSSGGGNGGHGGGTVAGNGFLCENTQDVQQQCDPLPDLSVGGELGNRPPFTNDQRVATAAPTTTSTSSCSATDDGGIANRLMAITNLSAENFLEVYYVANRETTISNFDGLINGQEAFKIDNLGSNTPLVSESIDPDNVFQAGETWEFILQDYVNALGLTPAVVGSMGIPSDLDKYSSGSLIGIVAGNGGTDTAGGWTGGEFGVGSTQPEAVAFPKNPGPEFPFTPRASGGGGGGWYGGGTADGTGAGGGSSYVTPVGSSGIAHRQGVRNGNGLIVIGTN